MGFSPILKVFLENNPLGPLCFFSLSTHIITKCKHIVKRQTFRERVSNGVNGSYLRKGIEFISDRSLAVPEKILKGGRDGLMVKGLGWNCRPLWLSDSSLRTTWDFQTKD